MHARLQSIAAGALLVLSLCLLGGAACRETVAPPKVESTLLDQQVRLEKGQVQKLPFEHRAAGELKVEIVHLSGEPIRVLTFDKQGAARVEQPLDDPWKFSLSFYTALSKPRVDGRFDSGWLSFPGGEVYSLVIWPIAPKKDQPFRTAIVNVRVMSR